MNDYQELTDLIQRTLSEPINTEKIINVYTKENIDSLEIYQGLIELLKRAEQEIAQVNRIEETINVVEEVAVGLRKYTREKAAVRFYYYGMFQVWADMFKDRAWEEKENQDIQFVTCRKRFSMIMDYLYENENVQQVKLAEEVKMNRSNLLHEMQLLTNVGFVIQRKVGKYKYYCLSPKGIRYYEKSMKGDLIHTGGDWKSEEVYKTPRDMYYRQKFGEGEKSAEKGFVGLNYHAEIQKTVIASKVLGLPREDSLLRKRNGSIISLSNILEMVGG